MELFYRHYGSGQALVILHGLLGISDNWVSIGKRLAEKFSVYIPDQRNHGQSPHSTQFDYPSLVSDVREFIETHNLMDPVIIGHSMGGKVAMQYALENPSEVDRLVVIDISPRRYPPRLIHQRMLSAMMSIDFQVVKSRAQVSELLGQSIENQRIKFFLLKNLYRPFPSALAWRPNIEAISHSLDLVFDDVPCHKAYPKASLFVKGGDSDYIMEEDIPIIKQCFPLAEIKRIPHATHWVHADKPEELCGVLSAFLGRECQFREDPSES